MNQTALEHPDLEQSNSDSHNNKHTKKREWRAFLFISVCLAPIIAVAVVGSYGLSIWVYQMIAGPPTGG